MSPRPAEAQVPLDPVALEAVAEELYSLPPSQFTATRDARSKEARARGERALATAVGKLRRPTAAAWLANLLVREEAAELEELLALGDALREAQAGLDAATLRQLSGQRHRVVAALALRARRLAAELGEPAGADAQEQLERTLEAAMSDPGAAEALRSGRLTSGLEYAGLGEPGGSVPAGRPAAPGGLRDRPGAAQEADAEAVSEAARREAARREVEQREREAAERALAEAEQGLAAAAAQSAAASEAARDAERVRTAADQQVLGLEARLAELRGELERATQAAARALADETQARAGLEAAERGAEVARRRVQHARGRLGRRDGA